MAGTNRTGHVGAVEYEDGTIEVQQDQLLQLMADMAGTLRVVGGMFAVTAEREEIPDAAGEGRTIGYTWMWQAFSPMRRTQPEDEAPMPHEQEPVPAPEPVEA